MAEVSAPITIKSTSQRLLATVTPGAFTDATLTTSVKFPIAVESDTTVYVANPTNVRVVVTIKDGTTVADQSFIAAAGNSNTVFSQVTREQVLTSFAAASSGRVTVAGAHRVEPTNASANSNGTDTGCNTRYYATFAKQFSRLRLAFPNWANGSSTHVGELGGANPITVRASIEYPNGTYTPVWFSGKRDIVIDAGSTGVSDTLHLTAPIPANTNFWIRTFVSVTSGQFWQQGPTIDLLGSDLVQGSVGETDRTTTTITGNTYNRPYSACGLIAEDVDADTLRVFCLGDSITQGQGDSIARRGWWQYATQGQCIGQRVAFPGEAANDLTTNSSLANRLSYLSTGCNAAIVAYGTNDFNTYTLAVLQANIMSICSVLTRRGMKVWVPTLLPRVTSTTDSYATVGGQTTYTNNSRRVQFNNWLRAGAPIDPTTKVAVAVGTAGALLSGTSGHPVSGYFEFADAGESSRDSGFWKVNGTANYSTADGTHPSNVIHQAMAAQVDLAAMRAAVGVKN